MQLFFQVVWGIKGKEMLPLAEGFKNLILLIFNVQNIPKTSKNIKIPSSDGCNSFPIF